MPTTRRQLLNAMAKLGGAGAVYETLAAWNFLKPPPAMAASFESPPQSGAGKKVVILGAGPCGVCAAYELEQAGYQCEILEPLRRAGGRCWTIRRGDHFQEMGKDPQVCEFDEGLYLNAGPGRIPHHHTRVIDYCRLFRVALEPYIFASRANLIHSEDGSTQPLREPLYSLQGRVAELLDQCTNQSDLALPVSKDELDLLQDMLVKFGDLTALPPKPGSNRPIYGYINEHARAGYAQEPGVADPGKPITPPTLETILRSRVWNNWLFRDAAIYWQTSLMQPTGGMDKLVDGFLRQPLQTGGRLGGLIRYGIKATGINVADDKVTVAFVDLESNRTGALDADYCISTVPIPIFRTMRTNLPDSFMDAAKKLPTRAAGKVGWQAPRFWEEKYNIFGGISWTNEIIDQIWYPSDGYLQPVGVLTGAYMSGQKAEDFNKLSVEQRLRIARDQGSQLHPEYGKDVEHGLAIGWNNMEFAQFGWADSDAAAFGPNVEVLAKPQGRFILAGDQITYWSGWIEGAVQAAWYAATAINRHAHPTRAQ